MITSFPSLCGWRYDFLHVCRLVNVPVVDFNVCHTSMIELFLFNSIYQTKSKFEFCFNLVYYSIVFTFYSAWLQLSQKPYTLSNSFHFLFCLVIVCPNCFVSSQGQLPRTLALCFFIRDVIFTTFARLVIQGLSLLTSNVVQIKVKLYVLILMVPLYSLEKLAFLIILVKVLS